MSAPAWIQVFLDVPAADLEPAVAFWSAVTGWRPSDRRGEDGQFLTLLPAAGSAYVKVQAIDGPPGVHLDLDSTDRPGGFTFCQTLLEAEPTLARDGSTILDQVCLDVPAVHWDAEVAFWAALTGREPQTGSLPEFVRLVQDERLRLLLQRLDEPDGPVRAHPDLASADRAADTQRHVALGATVAGVHDFWTVLTAPGGQVYCLTDRDPAAGAVRPV